MKKEQKITPFLWFDGNVEEAINFYTTVFKNSEILDIRRYGDDMTGGRGKVISARFQLEDIEFMILDGGPHYKLSPAFSFFVNCENQEEVDELWSKLTAGGGKESRCGWLEDKYGVSWQIIPTALGRLMSGPDPAKAKRVMQAMLQMNKIDVKALEKA